MKPLTNRTTHCAAALFAALLPACSDAVGPTERAPLSTPEFNIRLGIGEDSPGPPFYSFIQPGWFPMTDEWAAIAWVRETACVPDAFNILTLIDLTILFPPAVPVPGPRPFFCPLTVSGHEMWNTDPPNPAVGPLNVVMNGLGAVPIYFVSTEQLLPAIADRVLTINDLEAMSSLLVGYAHHFTLTNQLGDARGRPGTGKINITAIGKLQDGRAFFFETAEGAPFKTPIAHTRIEFH
jgi:hypothetical protein